MPCHLNQYGRMPWLDVKKFFASLSNSFIHMYLCGSKITCNCYIYSFYPFIYLFWNIYTYFSDHVYSYLIIFTLFCSDLPLFHNFFHRSYPSYWDIFIFIIVWYVYLFGHIHIIRHVFPTWVLFFNISLVVM